MSEEDPVEVNYDECVAETDHAVCLSIEEDDMWIPRSVIRGEAPDMWMGSGELHVQYWWAKKEGLI